MSDEIAAAALQRLLGINRSALSELVKKGIVQRGKKRGFYKLETSVSRYCAQLREITATQGDKNAVVGLRVGQPQPDTAEAPARLHNEVMLEKPSRGKWWNLSNRILGAINSRTNPYGRPQPVRSFRITVTNGWYYTVYDKTRRDRNPAK
jgi:hypothetical protein